jgi:hypothetical protein
MCLGRLCSPEILQISCQQPPASDLSEINANVIAFKFGEVETTPRMTLGQVSFGLRTGAEVACHT